MVIPSIRMKAKHFIIKYPLFGFRSSKSFRINCIVTLRRRMCRHWWILCKMPISLVCSAAENVISIVLFMLDSFRNHATTTFIIILRNATISTSVCEVEIFSALRWFQSQALSSRPMKWTNNSIWIISTLHKFTMKFIGMPWIFIKEIKSPIEREYEKPMRVAVLSKVEAFSEMSIE